MEREEEPRPGVLYQAGIVAFHAVHEKLEHLCLEVVQPREARADGSWIERVTLRSDQIEPIVKAGAVVVIEAMVDQRVPADWIISSEQALARLTATAKESGLYPAESEP